MPNVPSEPSQDALFAMLVVLVDLLVEKKVLTNGEFPAELALRSNASKTSSRTSNVGDMSPSTAAEVARLAEWLRDRHSK